MHSSRLTSFLFGIGLLAALALPISPSMAQEAPRGDEKGIGDLLTDLLGRDDGGSEQQPSRRIPFSREQIQLSYAPLVKKTAPAVVNVYASSRVQVRSPFMGDPFFE